jgi:hypothetical protein
VMAARDSSTPLLHIQPKFSVRLTVCLAQTGYFF